MRRLRAERLAQCQLAVGAQQTAVREAERQAGELTSGTSCQLQSESLQGGFTTAPT